MKFSIIIPVYNEEENIAPLINEIRAVCDKLNEPYEVIFIDDGSVDQSFETLKQKAISWPAMKVIGLRRNYGQTAAISSGIECAQGEVLIPMDSDLQNDPADIPLFLQKISEGYTVVSGWRKNRQDKLLTKVIPSQIANWIISRVTGVNLHDYGCTMKAYRRDFLQSVNLYGEMHRFIPAYAAQYGGKITEIATHHRPRKFGKSKYNIRKTFKVILDLLVVKFLNNYFNRPMHFFGGAGLISIFGGFVAAFIALYYKLTGEKSFIDTPLPLIAALFWIIGIQFILMGLLAELIIRTYHETRKKSPYLIKEKINL